MRLTRKTDQVVEPKAPALGLNRRQFLNRLVLPLVVLLQRQC